MANFRKYFKKTGPNVLSQYQSRYVDDTNTTSTLENGYFGWKLYFEEGKYKLILKKQN